MTPSNCPPTLIESHRQATLNVVCQVSSEGQETQSIEVSVLSSQESCPICIESAVQPISTDCCKQIFCQNCLQIWSTLKGTCPLCLAHLKSRKTKNGLTLTSTGQNQNSNEECLTAMGRNEGRRQTINLCSEQYDHLYPTYTPPPEHLESYQTMLQQAQLQELVSRMVSLEDEVSSLRRNTCKVRAAKEFRNVELVTEQLFYLTSDLQNLKHLVEMKKILQGQRAMTTLIHTIGEIEATINSIRRPAFYRGDAEFEGSVENDSECYYDWTASSKCGSVGSDAWDDLEKESCRSKQNKNRRKNKKAFKKEIAVAAE